MTATVTTESCRSRHKNANIVLGLISVLLAVVFVLPLWSFAASRVAEKKANDVDKAFTAHAAAQKTHEEHLHETLGEIKASQVRILDKLGDVEKAVNGH